MKMNTTLIAIYIPSNDPNIVRHARILWASLFGSSASCPMTVTSCQTEETTHETMTRIFSYTDKSIDSHFRTIETYVNRLKSALDRHTIAIEISAVNLYTL
jgi:hypothetical protein